MPTNIQEILVHLKEQESLIRQWSLPAGEISFLSPDAVLAGGAQLRLTSEGLSRICHSVGAPTAYLREIEGELRASLLQHHLDRGDLGEVLTVFGCGDQFLSFGRPDLLRLSSEDVMHAVLDGIGQDAARLTVEVFRHTPDSFQVDILGCETQAEIAPGDVLRAGLRITHSISGCHATWIEAFVLRLVCSNGLTHRDCVSRRAARTRRLPAQHPGARDLQRAQVRRLAADTWTALGDKLHVLRELQDERVDFEPLYFRLLGQARLSRKTLMPLLRQAWQTEGGQLTAYAVVNALTRVATHQPGLTPRQRRVLGALAGVLAFRRLHFCPRCFSMLGGPVTEGRESVPDGDDPPVNHDDEDPAAPADSGR